MIHINKEVSLSLPDAAYYDLRKIAPRQHSCNVITPRPAAGDSQHVLRNRRARNLKLWGKKPQRQKETCHVYTEVDMSIIIIDLTRLF